MVMDAILENEKDFALSTVAVEALALIGSTQAGKVYLNGKPGMNRYSIQIVILIVAVSLLASYSLLLFYCYF
jgi:hypothetical protein